MGKDYLNQPATTMRRDDRAVSDDAWIKQMLKTTAIGTLATVHDGQPFINTNLFLYDEAEHCVYIHTARVGRTRANVEAAEKVCFSVMEMGRLLPAPEALEFSVEYAGVVIFGLATIVDDEPKALHALQLIMDKYAQHLIPGEDYRRPISEEAKRTTVMRVDIESWSGKKKEVDPDFAGAYWYPENPMLTSVRAKLLDTDTDQS